MCLVDIITICITILLISCSNSGKIVEDSTTTVIKIDDLEKRKGKLASLQQVADEISFVNLVTPKEAPLACVSKLIEFDNQMFISDQKQKTIFVFDRKGQFLRKIGQNGRGPGEMVDLTDFYINIPDSCIIISDIGKKEILKFAMDGHFLSAIKTPLVGKCIQSLSSNTYALYSGFSSKYNLVVANDKFKAIQNLFIVEDYMRYAPIMQNSQALSYNYENELLYLPSYSNYVYSVTQDKIEVKFEFDFCDNKLSENYIKENFNGNAKDIRNFYSHHLGKTNFAYSPFAFSEDKEHLFFQFVYDNRKIYNSVLFKNDNYNIITRGWCFDKEEKVKMRGGFKNLKDGFLTGYFSTYHLVKSIDELSKQERDGLFRQIPSLRNFYNNKDLSDNPAIIKCKLKSRL